MDGQQQVMVQLAKLLEKANSGVDQAGPLLIKQVAVERIESFLFLALGVALLVLAYTLWAAVRNKVKAAVTANTSEYSYRTYDYDDACGWIIGSAISGVVGFVFVLYNVCSLIQLYINPLYYVVSQLVGK